MTCPLNPEITTITPMIWLLLTPGHYKMARLKMPQKRFFLQTTTNMNTWQNVPTVNVMGKKESGITDCVHVDRVFARLTRKTKW